MTTRVVRVAASWLFAGALLVTPLRLAAQSSVSAIEIDEAIQQGIAGHVLQATCGAFSFNADVHRSGYWVTLAGPLGRIMAAAKEATDRGQTFAFANVTEALRAPVVTVRVAADTAAISHYPVTDPPWPIDPPDPADRIVLRSAVPKDPKLVILEPIDAVSAGFRFDLTAFRGLPEGDIEVVITTRRPSVYSCKIDAESRNALR